MQSYRTHLCLLWSALVMITFILLHYQIALPFESLLTMTTLWSCNAWRNAIQTMTFTKLICVDPASMYIWGVMGCCIRGGANKASTAYHQFITCDQDEKSQFSFYLLCAFLLLWLHGQQMLRYKYKHKYNYKHKHKYKHKYKHKHHWTSPVRGRCRLHWGEGLSERTILNKNLLTEHHQQG